MADWKSGTIYCWDTSVLFAWLKAEDCHPLADIAHVVEEITDGKAYLIIPATTYEELCYSRLTAEQRQIFDNFTKRSNVMLADLSPPISRRSADIVTESQALNLVTKIRDARIAATAIELNATVLHSVDPDLLRLNGTDVVAGLSITKPVRSDGQQALI